MNEQLTILAGLDAHIDEALADLAPAAPVLVIADSDARVFTTDALEELAKQTTVLVAPGSRRAWLGRAGAVASARSGLVVPVVDDGRVFLNLDGTGTDHVVFGGRVIATAHGSQPGVVLGSVAELETLDALLSADSTDAMAHVLGYVDAADDGSLHEIAPELFAVPFWTPAMCRSVIVAAEAVDAWGSDPDDPVPGTEVALATISPALFANLEAHLRSLVVPKLRQQWPTIADAGVRDAFIIKYAPGESAELRLHHDVAQISGSVRLNEGYDGGVLEFPRQGADNRALPVGSLLLWPSLVTHPHRSSAVTRGVKYGLTIWLALPPLGRGS